MHQSSVTTANSHRQGNHTNIVCILTNTLRGEILIVKNSSNGLIEVKQFTEITVHHIIHMQLHIY